MLGNRLLVLIGGLIIATVIAFQLFLYEVREIEDAIIVRLGEPQKVERNAGLHFKWFYDSVIMIDNRNLEYDLDRAMEISDVNQERLTVDAFARYRVIEPLVYYQTFKTGAGDWAALRRSGEEGIKRIMQNSLRQTLGEVTIEDIITNQRAALMQSIAAKMREEARKFGVDIIDVKIRRADYPGDIAERVYSQMSSARKEEAELIRAEGQRENTRIQAEAERDRAVILARANRTALEIQGQADATRNCIFAGAYDGLPVTIVEKDPSEVETLGEGENIAEDLAKFDAGKATTISCSFADSGAQRDPARAEFFAFYRSLLAYEEALKKGETTILLSPDSEFFRYFNDLQGTRQ